MDDNFSFGYWLRRQRLARDLRQDELAAQVGVATITLRKLEADERRPSLQLIARVAEVLALSDEEREVLQRVARADLSPVALPMPDGPVESPAQSTAPVRILPRRLPHPLTPFIGRQREVADLIGQLLETNHHLLTLVAPGGMGKTRLALAAAEQLQSSDIFPDGVAFASLASLEDPAYLEATLADALGLPLAAGDQRSSRSQLLDFLREKALLLVLDNCEYLRDAVAVIAQTILSEAPEVTLLATSRERLGLRAERAVPLEGMVAEVDGVALFLFTARAVQPDLVEDITTRPRIAAICSQVGGMPLAIELAAGWADTLGLDEIAAELARGDELLVSEAPDLLPRHRSIRAVCDTTWGQLPTDLQAIFVQIAVFRGGGTRRALQTVTGASLPQLQALVGKALLRYDPERERYFVHEILRQYAEECLNAEPAQAWKARERHAVYYLTALAEREAELKGANQREALHRIGKDIANVTAAWGWAADHQAFDLLTAAAGCLSLAYEWLGRSDEGLGEFARAAAAAGLDGRPALHARFLAGQAHFTLLRGDPQAALVLLTQAEHSLNMSESTDDLTWAHLLLQFGHQHQRTVTDYDAASAAYAESLKRFEALGDRWSMARALRGLGRLTATQRTDYAKAQHYLEQSIVLSRALDDQIDLVETLNILSLTRRYLGDISGSLRLAREAYALAQDAANPDQISQAASNLGAALFWVNANDEACTVLHHALTITKEVGRQYDLPTIYFRLGSATSNLGRYAEARAIFTSGIRSAKRTGDALLECGLTAELSTLALREGDAHEALRLAQQALGHSESLGETWFRIISLAAIAVAARHLGDHQQARAAAVAFLRLGITTRTTLHWNLWFIGLLLADAGAATSAAAVLALSDREYLLDNVATDEIGLRELRTHVAALPTEVHAAARDRWANHDYWTALGELLAELEALEWFTTTQDRLRRADATKGDAAINGGDTQ